MSFDACAALTQSRDPDRFHAAMTAPPERRGALLALYAFNSEIARAPWVTAEPMIAEMRLQWWLDAIEEIYEGKPARAHEVAVPLAETIAAHALPRAAFERLITARRFDIGMEPHSDRTAFDAYIDTTAGDLMVLAARTLCPLPPGTEGVIRQHAFASGFANMALALPALYASGRDPIPTGWVPDRNLIARGIAPDPLQSALRLIAGDAIAHRRAARLQLKTIPRAATPALLAGWQSDHVLKQVFASPETVLNTNLRPSGFRSRLRLMLRAATGRW